MRRSLEDKLQQTATGQMALTLARRAALRPSTAKSRWKTAPKTSDKIARPCLSPLGRWGVQEQREGAFSKRLVGGLLCQHDRPRKGVSGSGLAGCAPLSVFGKRSLRVMGSSPCQVAYLSLRGAKQGLRLRPISQQKLYYHSKSHNMTGPVRTRWPPKTSLPDPRRQHPTGQPHIWPVEKEAWCRLARALPPLWPSTRQPRRSNNTARPFWGVAARLPIGAWLAHCRTGTVSRH